MTRFAVAAAVAAALAAPPATAEGEASVDIAGVVLPAREDGPVFFGRAGQIYEPADDEAAWRRRALGGVALEVSGVVRTASGLLFAAGTTTPLFRREGDLWFTHELPNRGPLTLSTGGGVPALGVGRHIYLLRGDDWTRSAHAPDDIAALWAGGSDRIYLATQSGELYRGRGRQFRQIAHPLDPDDTIEGLIGRPGNELYAIAASGAVLEVGPSRARAARIPDSLAGSRIDAFGYLPDGTPAVAMRVAGDGSAAPAEREDGQPRFSAGLVALRDGALALEAALPGLASPGDPIAAIGARAGATVIATRSGNVAIRDDDDWREGSVSAAPPTGPDRYQGASPARSP